MKSPALDFMDRFRWAITVIDLRCIEGNTTADGDANTCEDLGGLEHFKEVPSISNSVPKIGRDIRNLCNNPNSRIHADWLEEPRQVS